MIKKFIYFSLLTLALLVGQPASAHIMLQDQSIFVLLHAEPGDDPIIGEPATLYFSVTDKNKQFNSTDCDCRLSISLKKRSIYEGEIGANKIPNSRVLQTTFTFPRAGIYEVVLTGQPKTALAFQPFKLTYNFRVSRESDDPPSPLTSYLNQTPTWTSRLAIGIITLVVLIVLRKIMSKKLLLLLLVVGGTILINPKSSSAHVVVRPNQVGVGSFQTFNIGVPSEKEFSTIGLRLELPAGLEHVTPTVKSGWQIEVSPTEIIWRGGRIPAHQRDDFSFSAKVPAEATALIWKAYQSYSNGSEVAWANDPKGEQTLDEEGQPDFSKFGPYSETKIVDDLGGTAFDLKSPKTASILALIALVLALIALVKSAKRS
ncbi:MAG: YcnI family protein [Patescibacteria group bacterium]